MDNIDLKELTGVGEKTLNALSNLGIFSINSLINQFPKSYEDFHISNKDVYVGTIVSEIKTSSFRIVKSSFSLKVDNKIYHATIFQKPYIHLVFHKNDQCLIKGKIKDNKFIIVSHIKHIHKLDLIDSKYHLKNVPDFRLRYIIRQALESDKAIIEETIPLEICRQFDLFTLKESFNEIHNPTSYDHLEKALKRFKVEEARRFYKSIDEIQHRAITNIDTIDIENLKKYVNQLPYELTNDQTSAIYEIIEDLNGAQVLERLIQGDVGSGKTIVAFLSSLLVIEKGFQVAFMSPTEVLSQQHFENFKTLFPTIRSINITSQSSKKDIEDTLKGNYYMIFGTHALAYPTIRFKRLSLVIIDEQHKFGVDIRKKLRDKSMTRDLLYLTATPIPRSLMHVMYGNAKISSIKTIPKGRQKITSLSIYDYQLEDIHDQVKKAISLNQHVYFVAPAINFSETKLSIVSLYESFKQHYGEKLFILHGQLEKEEQIQTIQTFKQSQGAVLLSTTMIEVGMDIKTATFMIVLDALNFGMSQLHQLRGRIGRGNYKGVFYMLSKDPDHPRLQTIVSHQDGFEISEKDLQLRGAGNLIGLQQSGKSELKMADYYDDYDIFVIVKSMIDQINTSKIKHN